MVSLRLPNPGKNLSVFMVAAETYQPLPKRTLHPIAMATRTFKGVSWLEIPDGSVRAFQPGDPFEGAGRSASVWFSSLSAVRRTDANGWTGWTIN